MANGAVSRFVAMACMRSANGAAHAWVVVDRLSTRASRWRMATERVRPRSITIVGWLFVAVGAVGLPGAWLHGRPGGRTDIAVAALSALVALAGGIGSLRGRPWARWMVLLWLAFHVVLSSLHALGPGLFHGALLLAIGCVLFRPPASAYFRGGAG